MIINLWDIFMKIPIYLGLKLTSKVLNSPFSIIRNFNSGTFIVRTKMSLTFKVRGKTKDLAEIIGITSGFEYPFDLVELPPNPTIVDIGGHIGIFSINICNMFVNLNPNVYCYEPFEYNYELLNENVRINRFEKYIKTYKKAIGTENKIVYLENIEVPNGIKITEKNTGHEVEQISLYDIFNHLNFKKIDLLKIDIEGGELEILDKYYKELSDYCDKILVEIHYGSAISDRMEAQLSSVGFKLRFKKDIGTCVIYMVK